MAQLAGRYSNALFELAIEKNNIDEIYEQVNIVMEICSEAEFVKLINHPQVTSQQKMQFIEDAFKGKVSDDLLGLFNLLLAKNRESEILAILNSFIKKVDSYKGRVVAYVSAPRELTGVQLDNIKNNLSKNLSKHVEIRAKVDPGLIGGLCVEVDGIIIDGTIKKQIYDLKKTLLDLQLAQ